MCFWVSALSCTFLLSHHFAAPFTTFLYLPALWPAFPVPCVTFPCSLSVVVPQSLVFQLCTLVPGPLSTSLVYSPCIHLREPQLEFSILYPLHFRSQQALYSSPMFPTLLHTFAALSTSTQHVPNLSGHLSKVTCHVLECMTVSDHIYLRLGAANHVYSQHRCTCTQLS